jgi:ketosteroid isomerase-like protein
LPQREAQFSRNRHTRATDKLAGLLCELSCRTLLSERGTLGISPAENILIGGILGKNTRPKGATVMLRPFILLLAVSALPLAQNSSKAEGDETKIIALENLWNQMQINHDADAMGKMLESDFVLTDYDGTVMSKGQFLASVRDTSNQLTVEVSTDMKLHRHGDTVIVIGATREKGTDKGKPYTHQGRFTDTWIKKDGQWLCIASQLGLIGK